MTTKADHESVRREGKRFRTNTLEVRHVASPLASAPTRVGLIVPRHKRSAVARNRLKRRLRELVRLTLLPALQELAPMDLIIRATPEAYAEGYDALAAEVTEIARRMRKGSNRATSRERGAEA